MHRGHSPGITLTEHQCSGLKDEHRILILSQIILTYGDSLPNLLEYTRLSPSSTQSPTLTRRVLELRAKRVQGTSFRWGQHIVVDALEIGLGLFAMVQPECVIIRRTLRHSGLGLETRASSEFYIIIVIS